MIDFMWEHTSDLLPGFNWDWLSFGYPVDPLTVDRVALWAFRGEAQIGVGLTALLASTLGWLNTAKTTQLIDPATFQAEVVRRTPTMTHIDPTTFMPFMVNAMARVWGELNGDSLAVHFQAANGERTDWTLQGDLVAIVEGLLNLSLEIQQRLGIEAPRRPDEMLDLRDPALLADFIRAWGEVLISVQFLPLGIPEFAQGAMNAIRALETATLVGSRFACWGACHALSTVIAQANPEEDDQAPLVTQAQGVLLNLGTLFPKVGWPSILLGILALADDDVEQAVALLESAVESDPLLVIGWRLLIALYEVDENYAQAITVAQEAIVGELADGPLYAQIGLIYFSQFIVAGIDDEQQNLHANGNGRHVGLPDGDLTTAEADALASAREAYQRADQMGYHAPNLYSALIDVAQEMNDSDLLWTAFRSLAEADTDGTWLIAALSLMEEVEDFEPGLMILRDVTDNHPDRFAVLMAYCVALIAQGLHVEAEQELPRLRQLARTDSERVEAASLALEAADPDFADSFETLDDELTAGAVADAGAISYLEEVLSREPLFVDGAIALATAYESRQEIDTAIGVLENIRQQLPNYGELLLSEADILWGDDRDEDAVALLIGGLGQAKPEAAVAARISEYYLMNEDPIQSLIYLNTALMLDPFDAEVERVSDQVIEAMEAGLASGAFDDDDFEGDEN